MRRGSVFWFLAVMAWSVFMHLTAAQSLGVCQPGSYRWFTAAQARACAFDLKHKLLGKRERAEIKTKLGLLLATNPSLMPEMANITDGGEGLWREAMVDDVTYADPFILMAEKLKMNQKYFEARKLIEEALAQNPRDSRLLAMAAVNSAIEHDFARVQDFCKTMETGDHIDFAAFADCGGATWRAGDQKRAEYFFRRADEKFDHWLGARIVWYAPAAPLATYASLLATDGQRRKAIEILQDLEIRKPYAMEPLAYRLLGSSQEKEGLYLDAAETFKRAMDKGYSFDVPTSMIVRRITNMAKGSDASGALALWSKSFPKMSKREVLQVQVRLKNGLSDYKINGQPDRALETAMRKCIADPSCFKAKRDGRL